MKTDAIRPTVQHGARSALGQESPSWAGARGISVLDATTEAHPVRQIIFRGAHITDNDDGSVVVEFDETSILSPTGLVDHGAMDATETIDVDQGNWHRGTLNDDCAITVEGFTADEGVVAIFEVTQNATGGYAITWDADVDFGTVDDQPDQDPLATTLYLLVSSQGDSPILGLKVGGGGSSVGALDDLSDVTITSPQEDDTIRRVGGVFINDNRRWEPVTTNSGTGPELVWDGDDIVMTWRAY